MKKILALSFVLGCILLATSAQAAMLVTDGAGQLTGATDVQVGTQLYNKEH